jgi:transcriptional regulator with XRE-family HTH domain
MLKDYKSSNELGNYLHSLRKQKKFSLKTVADKLGIDISLLSKIENGERQLQSYMVDGISELFELDSRELQIHLLNQKMQFLFGNEPYFNEAIQKLAKQEN